jgi:hypothetical protein
MISGRPWASIGLPVPPRNLDPGKNHEGGEGHLVVQKARLLFDLPAWTAEKGEETCQLI